MVTKLSTSSAISTAADGPLAAAVYPELWQAMEAKARAFFELSDGIWAEPELNYQEHRAAARHTAMLEREGFRVDEDVRDSNCDDGRSRRWRSP